VQQYSQTPDRDERRISEDVQRAPEYKCRRSACVLTKLSDHTVNGRISSKSLAPENRQALRGQRLRAIRGKGLAEVVLPLDIVLKTRLMDQYLSNDYNPHRHCESVLGRLFWLVRGARLPRKLRVCLRHV